MANSGESDVQRGIAALRAFLGTDAAASWLESVAPLRGEAAAFALPLPVDFTGTVRHLRIGFPINFPRDQLGLHVQPSPWLQWPHAMEDGLCLHGFQEQPITGSPESVVYDGMRRLARILSFSVDGADSARRAAEFEAEITSYWSCQLKKSTQNLLLLNRPAGATALFALSDPRHAVLSGRETLWLSNDKALLRKHQKRVTGLDRRVRAPATPGFFIKLQTHPPVRLPQAATLFDWITPHLAEEDLPILRDWLKNSGGMLVRWFVVELPGAEASPLYCFNLRSTALQARRGARYGLRTSRGKRPDETSSTPTVLQVAPLDLLERSVIHSRELSGLASVLEQCRIILVGLGSLGSPVAVQLARAGVGHLTLIDPDTLVGENLGRHVLGMDELGKPKASALRARLHQDLPLVEVDALNTSAQRVMREKPEVFEGADLVIVTTADWASEAALWRAKSHGTHWSLLQAWSEPNALVGHALIATETAADARGLFNERGDFSQQHTEWPNGGVVPLPACGESFIPGGVTGIACIVTMVVQSAVRILCGQAPATGWVTSISTPKDVARHGGRYQGPPLEDGQMQLVLERPWPE